MLEERTAADFEFRYVEISDVDAIEGIRSTNDVTFASAPSRARRCVSIGDVIISTVRTYLRAIAPITHENTNAIVSTGFAVIRPRLVVPGYLAFLLRSEFLIAEIISRSVGVSYPAINANEISHLVFPCPTRSEQSAIAAFLDHETGKIDALVAEQERLIALLKEKRQAVISHAVTKGLDPTVPMKDSGVEWLAEVPAHWSVRPIWQLFRLGRGRVISHGEIAENPGVYPVYSSQTDDNGEMGAISTFEFEGDFITWTTDGANAGTVFRRSGKFNCTNVCGTLQLREDGHDLDYFWRCISVCTAAFVRLDINPKLMNNVMAGIRIAVPPLGEQTGISSFIDKACLESDTLSILAARAIALLKERRAALISAAVTGKIDLRRHVATARANAA